MPLKHKPFTRTKLDEETAKDNEKYGKPFTVRLNPQEQIQLDKIKALLDIKSDGTALKVAALGYYECITSVFSPAHLSWLFKKERTRLSDYEDRYKWLSEKL